MTIIGNGFGLGKRAFLTLVLVGAAAGCMRVDEATTRNAPLDDGIQAPVAASQQSASVKRRAPSAAKALPSIQVTGVTVDVPRELKVSEANSYYPDGDIVWRGDPMGDRHAQVASIVSTAARAALAGSTGSIPAVAEIRVVRFHALTEKARFTIGGWHNVDFVLTLRDPATGAVIAPPRMIKTQLNGYGGTRALNADQAGQTQKVRITNHLVNVISTEVLGKPARPIVEAVATPAPPARVTQKF